MEDLPVAPRTPLADALRPRSIGDVIGQRHLLGPGRPLDAVLRTGRAHSMILWGPPGVGKTTLARLIAEGVDSEFVALSAVMADSVQIRAALERATDGARGRRSTLFIDEIHRLNKAQQELLLPPVRSGLVTLIGATTGNPSFALKSALYLAVADKSNAASGAFGQAMAFVKHGGEVPSSGWYVPAPRGLESRIAEQMARLRGREGGR